MAWSNKETLANSAARIHVVSGSFPISTPAVTGTLAWNHVGAVSATFTYTTAATKVIQEAFTITVTTGSTAACSKVHATTHNDCTFVTFGETGWKYSMVPHGITGGGCKVYEDATGKLVHILYESGVTTMTQMKTAINATCTKVRAYKGTKTAAFTATELLTTATTIATNATFWPTEQMSTAITLVVVATTTVATVAGFVNDTTLADKKVTLTYTSGACSKALAAADIGDTRAAVDAIALNATYKTGADYTVARSGAYATHAYTITFGDSFSSQGELFALDVGVKCTSAAAQSGMVVIPGAYGASAKTLVLYLSRGDLGGASGANAIASDADIVPSTNVIMMSFRAEFRLKN